MAATGFVEARYYGQELGLVKFTSRRKDEIPRKAYMDSKKGRGLPILVPFFLLTSKKGLLQQYRNSKTALLEIMTVATPKPGPTRLADPN